MDLRQRFNYSNDFSKRHLLKILLFSQQVKLKSHFQIKIFEVNKEGAQG
jgi:hypothetical protein